MASSQEAERTHTARSGRVRTWRRTTTGLNTSEPAVPSSSTSLHHNTYEEVAAPRLARTTTSPPISARVYDLNVLVFAFVICQHISPVLGLAYHPRVTRYMSASGVWCIYCVSAFGGLCFASLLMYLYHPRLAELEDVNCYSVRCSYL